jgi:hypothetical protein
MDKIAARQFKCTNEGCGATVETEMPEGIFINKPTVSMLVMVHQEVAMCPNCGQGYSFVIRGVTGISMGWMPIVFEKKEENSGIVLVPNLSAADMEKLKGQEH